MSRPNNDLLKLAMLESCDLARAGVLNCWATQLHRRLSPLGVNILTLANLSGQVPSSCLMTSLRAKWSGQNSSLGFSLDSLVRAQPDCLRSGFKSTVYFSWFYHPTQHFHDTCWYNLHNYKQICNVARFRMGAHKLNIETERYGRGSKPRSARICKCCDSGEREDEMHFLHCPLYEHIREYYGFRFSDLDLFGQDYNMFCIVNGLAWTNYRVFWTRFAIFLDQCYRVRNNYLSLSS